MNDLRKFAYILVSNGINNYQDYTPVRMTKDGTMYVKNSKNGKYLKMKIDGSIEVETVSMEESTDKPISKVEKKNKEVKENLMYKNLDPHEILSSITKNNHHQEKEDKLKNENIFDGIEDYNFNDVETVSNKDTIPNESYDIDIEVEQERLKKEFEELKKKQEEELEKKLKKKPAKKPAKKSVEGKPRGWHLMAEFVDSEGNVFHKGVEQPQLKGTIPPTKI
jgi:hypothetical protein